MQERTEQRGLHAATDELKKNFPRSGQEQSQIK
jgi:hypothetical protein